MIWMSLTVLSYDVFLNYCTKKKKLKERKRRKGRKKEIKDERKRLYLPTDVPVPFTFYT